MRYRGTINIDLSNLVGDQSNQYTRLSLALRESGWLHVETSAYIRDTQNIADLWDGIALVAKQTSAAGLTISALTFHIQGSDDFARNVDITSTQSPANALRDIRALDFPGAQ